MIKLRLPEGKYTISLVSEDTKTRMRLGEAERELSVPSGHDPLLLPVLRLEATFHQRMVGKPAPEIEATDLNTGRAIHLSDFRGKVVIIDFWGYWCGPCVGSMPHLIELHRQFQDRPLAIIALHDQSIQSRADYDRRIATVRKEFWGDQDLPFYVLLDRPEPTKHPDRDPEGIGLTCERYGVEAFPSLFVIDQQGTMVGEILRTQGDRLKSLVDELLDKSEL